jgi:hypothetical protein
LVTLVSAPLLADTSPAGGSAVLDRFKSDRRDPDWEVDGPAARRERRLRRRKGLTALAVSIVAVGFAAFAWSVELGLAAMLGICVTLPIG